MEEQKFQYRLTKTLIIISCITIFIEAQKLKTGWALVGNPLLHARPCKGNDHVLLSFEPGLPPEEENQYNLYIDESFPQNSKIKIKFDSEASVTLVSYPKDSCIQTAGISRTLITLSIYYIIILPLS